MVSPICSVADGGGSAQATSSAYATMTAGNTVTIQLSDLTGVSTWSIQCVYTDETSVAATVTAGLAVNATLKRATFTAPAAGKAYIFRSVVNGGVDANGTTQPSYTTTFKVVTLTTGGKVVGATNETTEHSSTYGYIAVLNDMIRNPVIDGSAGIGSINAVQVNWTPGALTTYPIYSRVDAIQTTDATATAIATWGLTDNRVSKATVTVTGYRPSNGDSYSVDLTVSYKRFSAGAPAIVGALGTASESKDDAAWGGATVTISGNNLIVRVTGKAASTINWSSELRIQERS